VGLLLFAMFFAPALMFLVAFVTVRAMQIRGVPTAPVGRLVALSVGMGIAGALVTLAYTIGWMIWYEKRTGFDAGNAPVAWIFWLGPGGFGFGQLVALLLWWRKRPRQS